MHCGAVAVGTEEAALRSRLRRSALSDIRKTTALSNWFLSLRYRTRRPICSPVCSMNPTKAAMKRALTARSSSFKALQAGSPGFRAGSFVTGGMTPRVSWRRWRSTRIYSQPFCVSGGVFIDVRLRNLDRCVRGGERRVEEERLFGIGGKVIAEHLERHVDDVDGEVIAGLVWLLEGVVVLDSRP